MLIRLAVVLALAWPGTTYAQFDVYGVKAAFVRNFVAFVEWPQARLNASDPLQLCVYNGSPILTRLTSLNIDPVRGHRVQVRAVSAVPDLGGCHIVFIPSTESAQIADIHSRYKGTGLLTISEERSELAGAAINLYVTGGKVAFDIDLAAADRLSVRISSKLLALARRVTGAPARPQGN